MSNHPSILYRFFATLLLFVSINLQANVNSDTQHYEPAFFMSFSPVNAADIVDRIPGAQVILAKVGGGGRGFNENSQLVLINGLPISAKSNGVRNILTRISADTVERVDMIRGGLVGLNVKSSETILDIRLRDEANLSSSWESKIYRYEENNQTETLSAYLNWQEGSTIFNGGLELKDRGKANFNTEKKINADNSVDYFRKETKKETGWQGKLSSSFSTVLGSENPLQLNGMIEPYNRGHEKYREQTSPLVSGKAIQQYRDFNENNIGYNWEASADYEIPLKKNKLKLQWIQTGKVNDREKTIWDLHSKTNHPQISSDNLLTTEDLSNNSGEAIAKLTYFNDSVEQFTSRSSLELVYNYLNEKRLLSENLQITSNTDEQLSEIRSEASWFGKWKPDVPVEIEFGSVVEYSQGRQAGDLNNRRDFTYFKPMLELLWKSGKYNHYLLSVKRNVGQLNLSDFTTSIDFEDNEIRNANPELEPQKAWAFATHFERVLQQDRGSINLHLFYNRLEDVIDQFPISATESTPGNIGSGKAYGVVFDADIVLTNSVRGTLNMVFQDSEVTDPFSMKSRELSNSRKNHITMELRKEFTLWPLSAGIKYQHRGDYQNRRIDEVNTNSDSSGFLDSFVQWQLPGKITLRLDMKNILDNKTETERVNYTQSFVAGDIDSTELFGHSDGQRWEFTISGQI